MPDRSIHDHIAHDLKSALSPIQTAAYVLRRQDPLRPGDMTELAAVIERQTRRLARMIDEAGEWQRVAHGEPLLRAEALVPGELLDAVLAAVDGTPRVAWITPWDVRFMGDGYRLQQMLLALLAFACGRDPERAPRVEVWAAPERLGWTITDAGAACAVATLFVRPDATPADGGLGLGLLTAQAIARHHGGQLRAAAIDGGGLRLDCEVRALPHAGS